MKLLVLLTATGAVSRIVFSCIFIPIYGMQGMYIGWALSWITESVLAIASFISGIWKKDMLQKTF
jgi:O-antigen/teichoic acid export membrane protein